MDNAKSELHKRLSGKEIVCYIAGVIFMFLVIGYCKNSTSPPSEFKIAVPDTLSPEGKVLLSETWPKIRKAAPGLDKYAAALKIVDIRDSLLSGAPGFQRLEVEILIPEGKSMIPAEYRAWGQHCHLNISKDGKLLSVAKTPCKSVLLDKKLEYDPAGDLVLDLGGGKDKSSPVETTLLFDRLDAKKITKGLPLKDHQVMKSGNGRKKQYWAIRGLPPCHFEVIGDDQRDADQVGWQCAEYDSSGNHLEQNNKDTKCYKLFRQVLANVVDKPDELATELLFQATASGTTMVRQIGMMGIETDGQFYFIRRR